MNSLQISGSIVDAIQIRERADTAFAFFKLKVRKHLMFVGEEPFYYVDVLLLDNSVRDLAELKLPRKVLIEGFTATQPRSDDSMQNVVQVLHWEDLGDGAESEFESSIRHLQLVD